ncbi:division/cell wall cluster transcriptional repressor MraZ [Verrucomicrobiota bacterium]
MEAASPILDQEVQGQGVFVGQFEHNLDPKKRLTIPAEWRIQTGKSKGLYILPNVRMGCLNVLQASEMVLRIQKMREHPISDEQAQIFARHLGSRSDLVSWDSQGRIRVSDLLLDFAGLADRVVMLGAFVKFELWNPDRYRERGEASPEQLQEATTKVGF